MIANVDSNANVSVLSGMTASIPFSNNSNEKQQIKIVDT